jgi:hypothetical protein
MIEIRTRRYYSFSEASAAASDSIAALSFIAISASVGVAKKCCYWTMALDSLEGGRVASRYSS